MWTVVLAACSGFSKPDTDPPLVEADVDYSECAEYRTEDCPDGACAATDEDARIYGLWKEQAMASYGLTEDELLERFRIRSAGMVGISFEIDVTAEIGWVETEWAFKIGVDETDTDEALLDKWGERLDEYPMFGLSADALADPDAVATWAAAWAEGYGVTDFEGLDWCEIYAAEGPDYTPTFVIWARVTLDWDDNRCAEAMIDLQSAEALMDTETQCWPYE